MLFAAKYTSVILNINSLLTNVQFNCCVKANLPAQAHSGEHSTRFIIVCYKNGNVRVVLMVRFLAIRQINTIVNTCRSTVHATDTDVIILATAVSSNLNNNQIWVDFGHGANEAASHSMPPHCISVGC